MSGQIDVGWATPPFGIQALEEGKTRIIARGNDIPENRNQTNRLLITSAGVLERRKAAIDRYMDAYRETVEYMYANPMALKYYAEIAAVPESLAKRVRDEFFTKEMLMPDRVIGMDIIMPAAVALKYVAAPNSGRQAQDAVSNSAGASVGWAKLLCTAIVIGRSRAILPHSAALGNAPLRLTRCAILRRRVAHPAGPDDVPFMEDFVCPSFR